MIEARELTKHFKVHKRPPGFGAAMRSLVRRKYETVVAVDGVSFSIAPGERVGFLGPNGAGKTTTLKMLSGLLHPTSGELRVGGFTPREREPAFLKQITLVMGQKQQLLWDLPPAETFDLNRAIYDVPLRQYRETLAEVTELLELGDLVTKPTRQLSLGERMKCELAASLLHRPRVLFLDEPTIGLDVSMQATVRSFVRTYNERYGATVLLTSHYMEDVAALCPRVIIIDRGRLVHDGPLEALVHQIKPHKRIAVRLSAQVAASQLEGLGQLISQDEAQVVLQVPHEGLPDSVSRVLSRLPVVDLSIEDPPLEEVFREIYKRPATFIPQERG